MRNSTLSLAFISALMAGCGDTKLSTDVDRENYWSSRVTKEVPAGISRTAAEAWALRNGMTVVKLEKPPTLVAVLEVIPAAGLRKYICTDGAISLVLDLAENETIARAEVLRSRKCIGIGK